MDGNKAVKCLKIVVGLAAIAALLWMGDDCSGALLAMPVIAGVAGGKHVVEEPLTLAVTKQASPDLIVNEIDRRIVKIRPMATPVDQLSRYAGAKRAGSMVVDYYSVDTRPTTALTTSAWAGPGDTGSSRVQEASFTVDNPSVIEVSETVLVKGVPGYEADGVTPASQDLVLYIKEKDGSTVKAVAVNGQTLSGFEQCVPAIPSGTTIVRMGRAASELDVQTPQFEALPVKSQNFCQIFKMQIEQSTLHKIANKEVGWTFSDQEEAAVYDMRLGMEKNFLFGIKARVYDEAKHEDILLTGGIWGQAGGEFRYEEGKLDQNAVISMMRKAFTGNAGNKRRRLRRARSGRFRLRALGGQHIPRRAVLLPSRRERGRAVKRGDGTQISAPFGRAAEKRAARGEEDTRDKQMGDAGRSASRGGRGAFSGAA